MIISRILSVVCLLSAVCALDYGYRLDNNITVPLHYNVELTVDIEGRKFFGKESIQISVLEDTEFIQLNSFGQTVHWDKTRIVREEDGVEQKMTGFMVDIEWQRYSLLFEIPLKGGSTYVLYIDYFEAAFGHGLLDMPITNNEAESPIEE